MFKKVLHGLQDDNKALSEKKVMFIHQVLDHIFSDKLDNDEWEMLGTLMNAIKAQMYDNNHSYSSTHTLEDIVEFCVHLYHMVSLCPGGTYIPLLKRIAVTGAVINPINQNNNRCFKYCIYLGLLHIYNKKRVHMERPHMIFNM